MNNKKVVGSRQVTYVTYDDGSEAEFTRKTIEGYDSVKSLMEETLAKLNEGDEITFLSVYKNQDGKFAGDMDISKKV